MAARFINFNKCFPYFYSTSLRLSKCDGRRNLSILRNQIQLNTIVNISIQARRPWGLTMTRFMSSSEDIKISTILGEPNVAADLAHQISEPSFDSLGLGGNTPIGLIQQVMEYIHVGIGLPWWGTIIATTLVFRMLMMPLVIRGQANAAKLNNIKPELDILTQRMRDVANQQDQMKKAETSRDLQNLFLKYNCHPLKSLITPVVQLPLFVSFFLGIRQMANLPLESMKTGGLLWFPDLTIADPYFLLPMLSAASMLLTVEVGAEAGVSNPQFKNVKQVVRIMAILMIPLTAKFPAGVFTYWVTSNMFSMGQMLFLRIQSVRNFFGIPEMVDHSNLKTDSGGFLENLKAGYKNAQNLAVIKHKEQQKQKMYELAAKEPLRQTFETNPLAQSNEQLFQNATGARKNKSRNNKQNKFMNDM